MKRWITAAAAVAVLCIGSAEAKPFKTESKSRFLEFEYGWSSEANAIPALARRFTTDMRKQRASMTSAAQSDAAERKKNGYPFHPYSQVTSITTAGQSPRLLSLNISNYAFTGGAHGNSGTTALLWDRAINREIKLASLFIRATSFSALTWTAYCKALDEERLKRRNGEKLGGDFNQCPKLTDLAITPTDKDKDGRFDTVMFVASPYVAGPYAEGEYEIGLPVTRQLMAAIKPAYRTSFEPQRQ